MSVLARVPLPADLISGLAPDVVHHVEHGDARVVLTHDG